MGYHNIYMNVKMYCIQCFNFRSHKLDSEIADSLFKPRKLNKLLKKKFFFETAVPSGGGIWELNKSFPNHLTMTFPKNRTHIGNAQKAGEVSFMFPSLCQTNFH